MLPSWIILDEMLTSWLVEDIGRGDRSTLGLGSLTKTTGTAHWVTKQAGIVAGLTLCKRIFYLLDPTIQFIPLVSEGAPAENGQTIAEINGALKALLTGERVALNLAMRLSGIATMSRRYAQVIEDLPTTLVDTRKTTPGLRILEKYAAATGGAQNHRMGLDDGVMLKENHIMAAGGIEPAMQQIRRSIPYPLSIEVETENLEQVAEAIAHKADIIMLDNMSCDMMRIAVNTIRAEAPSIKIEASGNITLETIRAVAETGVDYISTSAPITRSPWLDISMRIRQ